jgi:FkbM family methyltransferase
MLSNKNTLELWYRDDAISNFLYSFELPSINTIMDIGSYCGNWLINMNKMYGSRCIGIEPIDKYALQSIDNFNKNNISSEFFEIHNFGLTVHEDGEQEINISEDSSSLYIKENNNQKKIIKLKNVKNFLNNIDYKIDVLQINAEGIEYELVPFMLNNNLFKDIKNIQIQFHIIDETSELKMNNCIKDLSSYGYRTKFNYPFVWYGAALL